MANIFTKQDAVNALIGYSAAKQVQTEDTKFVVRRMVELGELRRAYPIAVVGSLTAGIAVATRDMLTLCGKEEELDKAVANVYENRGKTYTGSKGRVLKIEE